MPSDSDSEDQDDDDGSNGPASGGGKGGAGSASERADSQHQQGARADKEPDLDARRVQELLRLQDRISQTHRDFNPWNETGGERDPYSGEERADQPFAAFVGKRFEPYSGAEGTQRSGAVRMSASQGDARTLTASPPLENRDRGVDPTAEIALRKILAAEKVAEAARTAAEKAAALRAAEPKSAADNASAGQSQTKPSGATSSGATSGWHIGLVDGKPALVPDEPPRYEPPQTKVIVNAFRGVDTGNETANKIVNEHINPFLNVINPAFGGLNAVLVLDDLFRRAAPDLHAGLMTVPALAPEHGIAEAAQAVEHGIVSAARSNALRSAVQAPIFWFMTAGGVGGSVPGLATKAPKAVQEVTPLAKVSGEVAPFRMPTVRAGKELYIKNYLDLTVQKAVTEAAAMTEAAPARAALNLPPKIGFINPFQKAGYVVEYTTKARLDSGAVSGRTFRGLSLIEQLRPGKNPDVLLNEPFASMWSTVSPWDVTTAKQAVVKAANGVEWTFVVYEINWAALFKNALSQ